MLLFLRMPGFVDLPGLVITFVEASKGPSHYWKLYSFKLNGDSVITPVDQSFDFSLLLIVMMSA